VESVEPEIRSGDRLAQGIGWVWDLQGRWSRCPLSWALFPACSVDAQRREGVSGGALSSGAHLRR